MKITQTIEHHPLYGDIRITINSRARHIILRARSGIIEATIPYQTNKEALYKIIEKHSNKLLEQCNSNKPVIINETYHIDTENFHFSLSPNPSNRFYLNYKEKSATLFYPEETNFENDDTQQWLRRVRVTALRHIAEIYLPQRLQELASKYNFQYNTIGLRNSHSRWGSCNSNRNINLSIYLQLLPDHLIDYVILHELCHTIEMNHSSIFWSLMDNVTNKRAKSLRKELRKYQTDFS